MSGEGERDMETLTPQSTLKYTPHSTFHPPHSTLKNLVHYRLHPPKECVKKKKEAKKDEKFCHKRYFHYFCMYKLSYKSLTLIGLFKITTEYGKNMEMVRQKR